MGKNKEKAKKHNGGFITVIVLLAVILAALAGIAVLSTLGYFGGSSKEDESSEVDESGTTTDSSEDEGETHTHTYEFSYIAPTCTQQGYIVMTCTECGDSYKEAIPATGHTFETGEVTTTPTCTEDAVVSFACSVCGQTYSIVVEGTALGHDYSVIVNNADLGIHYTVCSRCGEYETGSASLCTYEENKYTYDEDGNLRGVCDVCGGLSVDTIEFLPASDDGTYAFEVNSGSGLTNALDALNSAERDSNAEPSTITLTEDLDLTEDTNDVYTFSTSNFILDGGEDGVTLDVGNQSVVSGENVTFSNLTFDGSEVSGSTRNAAVNVTGKDVTFDGCTIVGGESVSSGLSTAGILVTSSEANSTITVSNCDITGADRAIYFYNAASDVDLYVSDTYLEAVYAFNKTGSGTGSITFVNSTLMGWTSYAATTGEVTFTGCTFGFGDNNAHQCYGIFQGYSNATFDGCLFRSFVSRQTETVNVLTNIYVAYSCVGHDNYMFGLETDNIVHTLLDCSFEHVCDEDGSTNYSVETLTPENAVYLMSTDYIAKSNSGFKFSTDEEAPVYKYSCYSVS